ncbi:MAG: hypothetical protein DME26_03635 [Verrucomicrobia bacterium]|nr:MAG: hypothetical protein DME26_03635 [Verrucomicrobiota bacterium]
MKVMDNSIQNKKTQHSGPRWKTKAAAFVMALAAIAAVGILTASAGKPEHKQVRNSTLITDNPMLFFGDYQYDSNGIPAVSPDTAIYANSSGECDHIVPTIAPDGHYITLGEWQRAKGVAQAVCTGNGTEFRIKLWGLTPNGVHTVWLALFDAPGVTPDASTWKAFGALGLPDGSQNHVVANAKGEGELSVFQSAGPLSGFGA